MSVDEWRDIGVDCNMLQVISAPVHLSIEYPDCNQATLDVNESELAAGDTLSGFKSPVTKSPSTDTMTGVVGGGAKMKGSFYSSQSEVRVGDEHGS